MKTNRLLMNIFFTLFSIFLAQVANADQLSPKWHVDLYRSRQITADEIYQRLKPEFDELAKLLSKKGSYSKATLERMNPLITKIFSEVQKSGKFSFINMTPILYPGGTTVYFTLDLVDETDKQRLQGFSKKPTQTIEDHYYLIPAWQKYEKIGWDTYWKTRIIPKHITCSSFHCLFGFESPRQKKYQKIFDTYVPKAKMELIQILRNDKDEKRRAAAAYLLAHLQNGKEIVQILIPSMRDSSEAVRNNAMRVLGATLAKIKDADFPIHEAIDAIDFPRTTDRNKGLYILDSLALQPRYAKYITKHAGAQLIEQLKLYQKNLHDLSYTILKKISGKNYAERDYHAWELWLKENQ